MSPLILKDILNVDGDLAVKDIRKTRNKTKDRMKRKIGRVNEAVTHFESKMKRRRVRLMQCIERSTKSYFTCHSNHGRWNTRKSWPVFAWVIRLRLLLHVKGITLISEIESLNN